MSAAVRRPGISLGTLAARFPRFRFGTRRMRDHVSFEAVRCEKGEPGVYAIVTDDLGEMRDALREDAEEFPPGRQAPPGGDHPCDPDG